MIKLDCANPTLTLDIVECGATATSATLSAKWRPQYDMPVEIMPQGQMTFGPIPEDICPGVWMLSITTDCGCFQTPVHVDLCKAPAFPPQHTPTTTHGLQIECCPPQPPPLQPDWSQDAVTFGFTPGQVSAMSVGVNYQQTPTTPQAGTMLQPEPEDLTNIKVEQFQLVPPGEPFTFFGHIANAPATYAGATWKAIDHEGTLRGEGTTSYDAASQRLTLNSIDDLAGQTKYISSANPVFVTLTKA